MTVSYRSTATATQPNGTNGISVTVTKPSGTADGDLMIAVTHGYVSDTFTAPAGWKLLRFLDDSTGLRSRAYWKVASSEGASYVWEFQPGAGGGAIGVSISSFQGSPSGINQWDVVATSTADPAAGFDLIPTYPSMRYDVFVWRDTTSNTNTWSIGTETHDITAGDSGLTIYRGQSGTYHNTINEAGEQLNANSANLSAAPTFGIMWSFAIQDTAQTAESFASTGFGMEMELGGTWTDVSTYPLYEVGLDTKYGMSSEGGEVVPSTLDVRLKNTDNRFSPAVPTGTYFDDLALNTRARTWEAYDDVAMFTEGQTGDRFRTPQTDSNFVTGDLDVRVDCEPKCWRQEQVLAAQAYAFQSSLGNWVFYVDSAGYLHFAHGTSLLVSDVASTVQVPFGFRQTVRATIDVNNGASGHTVTFYTSDSTTGTFTQLGDAVVTAGTTTIGNDVAPIPLTVGAMESGSVFGRTVFASYSPFSGRIYEVMLKDGIAGTTVANPVFQNQTTGTYSFTDAQGNIWTATGNVICHNRWYRFHGELSSSPPSADTTSSRKVVDATFSGPLRRVQQNEPPESSALTRYYTNRAGIYTVGAAGAGLEGPYYVTDYWPLEDQAGSTQAWNAVADGRPGRVEGNPTFGDYDGFAASKPIMNFKTDSSMWLGVRQAGLVSGAFTVEFLLSAPSGITTGAEIMRIRTSGTDREFRLSYTATDQLTMTSWRYSTADGSTGDLVQNDTTGALSVPIAGDLNRITITAGDGVAHVWSQEISATAVTQEDAGALTVGTIGNITSVTLNPNGTMNDVYIGHVAVFDGTLSANGVAYGSVEPHPAYPHADALGAFNGENAGDRAERLILEEGFKAYMVGNHAANNVTTAFTNDENGEPMGPQTVNSFIANLRQPPESDMGQLVEPREFFGLGYRTRQSLYNQEPVMTLDFSNAELSGDLRPEFDDLKIKNKVKVTRTGGSAYTFALTTGPRGTDTVGSYSDAVDISLEADEQTGDQASWRVRLGTVNEYRFPSIQLDTANRRVAADSALLLAMLRLDIGHRIVVENPPDWLPPEDISQIVIGYEEHRDKFQRTMAVYTVPESPYRVGVTGSTTEKPRVNTAGCELAEALDTTETGVDVLTTADYRWVDSATYASDFPFDIMIGGEQMTVTACTGTTTSQTFTVTRSVNGVVKSHATGAAVSLFKPTYVGM